MKDDTALMIQAVMFTLWFFSIGILLLLFMVGCSCAHELKSNHQYTIPSEDKNPYNEVGSAAQFSIKDF